MGIGSKLDILIKEKHTNVNELALKVNVSPQTIYSMISRDSKKADIDVLLRIAKELGVNAEYFCDDYNEPQTIAAHFDGDEYTEDELNEIKQFAAFVKNKRS